VDEQTTTETERTETETERVEDSPAVPAPDTTPPGGDNPTPAAPAPSVPPHEGETVDNDLGDLDDDAPAAEDAGLGDDDVA
jgi:hypothetical protein